MRTKYKALTRSEVWSQTRVKSTVINQDRKLILYFDPVL